jgi:hypothetical protein
MTSEQRRWRNWIAPFARLTAPPGAALRAPRARRALIFRRRTCPR